MARQFSGALLRERREQRGLRRERLAVETDRSVYAIRQYECGGNKPTADVLPLLASALDCQIDDFYTEVTEVAR